ncbi:MAG: hypothetical protein QM535_22325, partial [Limnohabitans sp.]|nr:hypothetical protein [Limnohabitans sp.]
MKKGIVIILLILGVSKVYTQDLINEIQKMTLAIDSLHKQVIKPLNDSIFKLNAKVKEFNKKIKTLESTEADLNKNKVKIERDSLQAQLDSLTLEII